MERKVSVLCIGYCFSVTVNRPMNYILCHVNCHEQNGAALNMPGAQNKQICNSSPTLCIIQIKEDKTDLFLRVV